MQAPLWNAPRPGSNLMRPVMKKSELAFAIDNLTQRVKWIESRLSNPHLVTEAILHDALEDHKATLTAAIETWQTMRKDDLSAVVRCGADLVALEKTVQWMKENYVPVGKEERENLLRAQRSDRKLNALTDRVTELEGNRDGFSAQVQDLLSKYHSLLSKVDDIENELDKLKGSIDPGKTMPERCTASWTCPDCNRKHHLLIDKNKESYARCACGLAFTLLNGLAEDPADFREMYRQAQRTLDLLLEDISAFDPDDILDVLTDFQDHPDDRKHIAIFIRRFVEKAVNLIEARKEKARKEKADADYEAETPF